MWIVKNILSLRKAQPPFDFKELFNSSIFSISFSHEGGQYEKSLNFQNSFWQIKNGYKHLVVI